MTVAQFKEIYSKMDVNNVHIINDLYDENIAFIDPFHQISGLPSLRDYFVKLYKNVAEIEFEFGTTISEGNSHFVTWTMHLKHPKLNANRPFEVEGTSLLKTSSEGKVVYHRDYFDAGAMLYERVPVIGSLVRWLKGNL